MKSESILLQMQQQQWQKNYVNLNFLKKKQKKNKKAKKWYSCNIFPYFHKLGVFHCPTKFLLITRQLIRMREVLRQVHVDILVLLERVLRLDMISFN